MRRAILLVMLIVFTAVVCTTSCKHKQTPAPANGDFPDSIANIFLTKCTNAGCHNEASYQNAAGLLLDSWQHLLQGSATGAEVVAYNTELSPLLYYCNAYDSADIMGTDPGHLTTPLTLSEYMTIKRWVAAGAPDASGNIPFASNPDTRQKIYLTISGCNLVAVIDAQSRMIMRYIPVGSYPTNQSLHDVTCSNDGMYAYTSLFDGTILQKIDTRTDTVVAYADLAPLSSNGYGGWGIIMMAPADTALMVSGWVPNGSAVTINTATMQVNSNLSIDRLNTGSLGSLFASPHGLACNPTFDTFYATLSTGNAIAKFWVGINGKLDVPINIPLSSSGTPSDPHQIQMTPDYSRYFVDCQLTGQLYVFNRANDSVIKVIQLGATPQEMAISPSKNYLFVVCLGDADNPTPGSLGSVYVIDYNTLEIVTVLYGDFYQPHDVAVDEQDGLVYICSTNQSGPPPHHVLGNCSGRDGWYTVYNLNTLTMYNYRYQVPVFPYAITNRF